MIRSRLFAAFASALLPMSLAACGSADMPASEEAHGHGGGGIVVTDYANSTELFVEFRPLVQGKKRRFDAHLTWMDSYDAVTEGTLTADSFDITDASLGPTVRPTVPRLASVMSKESFARFSVRQKLGQQNCALSMIPRVVSQSTTLAKSRSGRRVKKVPKLPQKKLKSTVRLRSPKRFNGAFRL
jgi:hypothetical protein